MTYEETIELEKNIVIKNIADEIYKNFLKNVKLDVGKHKGGGKFVHWSDSHNQTYFILDGDDFTFVCNFLHENYSIKVNPTSIFTAIKQKYRGVDHLKSAVRDKG